jgi:Glyoxalase-like domain
MAEREQLIRAKAAEVVTAGASRVREESHDGQHLGHLVMLDPEDNEFCVA